MKTTLIALTLAGSCLGALAQGKITAENPGNIITLNTTNVMAQDGAFAGQGVPTTGVLPSGVGIVYGLYVGTSSSSLSLVTMIHVGTAAGTGQDAGVILPTHVVLPSPLAGGSSYFFQEKAWDGAFASYEAQVAARGLTDYLGVTGIFTMTPGASIAYPNIDTGGGSTLAPGPLTISAISVPEPASFALAGLAAAGMVIFRRRK